MTDERHIERRPEPAVPSGVNGDDDPWTEDMRLCMEAAELRPTNTYRQIAERQAVSVGCAFNRVKRWHAWVARLQSVEGLRGQVNARYEWIWQQCVIQYSMIMREARQTCADHSQTVPGCAQCEVARASALTPPTRAQLVNQLFLRMSELAERMARLHGLQQDASINVAAISAANATATVGGPALELPDDRGGKEYIARALRLVRRRLVTTGESPPRLPG